MANRRERSRCAVDLVPKKGDRPRPIATYKLAGTFGLGVSPRFCALSLRLERGPKSEVRPLSCTGGFAQKKVQTPGLLRL